MSERGSYRSVFETLADDLDFQNLTPLAQAVFWSLKLKLGPYGIAVFYPGVLEYLHRKASRDNIADALDELEMPKPDRSVGWLRHEQHVYWLVNAFSSEPHISPTNENNAKGARAYLGSLPRLPVVAQFAAFYGLSAVPSADVWEGPTTGSVEGGPRSYPSKEREKREESREKERETERASSSSAREAVPRSSVPSDELPPALRLVRAANQGMSDNPAIAARLQPIPAGHAGSLEAAEEIAAAGVPITFAESAIYELAKSYRPDGARNRQISTLRYCVPAVLDQWDKARATPDASSVRPCRNGRRRSEPVDYASKLDTE